jgi:membrane associated rhomboid family serine protease
MSYTTYFQWGPGVTPKAIFHLILWTSVVTLCSAPLQVLFNQFGLGNGPLDYLGLSRWGIRNWYIWQPITYLFVQMIPPGGMTFFYLIALFFNMYILWVMGSALIELVGTKSFLHFYFFTGIAAGLLALGLMHLLGHDRLLAGPAAAILALVTAWTMIYPEVEMLLFFLIPIKAKWVMAGIVGAILFLALTQGEIAYLALYMAGVVLGYLYAVCAWKLQGPFPWLHPFDRRVAAISSWVSQKLPRWTRQASTKESKIIDFKTGQSVTNDDEFVDAMLTKISLHGEKSLTRSERHRLHQISQNKSKRS